MFKVNNKKAINNLSVKSFRASKSRNIIAAIAIALTIILCTTLFTIGSGMLESVQQQTMRQSGGDGHIVLKYLSQEQYEKISSHKLEEEASYNKIISGDVTSPEFLKRRVEMYYMDDVAMRLGFCKPTTGNAPKLENVIAMDTLSLDLLGVPHVVGSRLALSYKIGEQEFTTDFVLSGFWESDTGSMSVGYGLVSEAFTVANAEPLRYTYDEDYKYSGAINSYVMCANRRNLQAKMERIILESGYTLASDNPSAAGLATDISCNTSWAYIGSGDSVDVGSIIAIGAALLLITCAGYLIIFNVFQISVLRDIRFFGLLKTIGTTGK